MSEESLLLRIVSWLDNVFWMGDADFEILISGIGNFLAFV